MGGCCDPSGYPGAFNRSTAERNVRSFLKRGLDSTAEPMVAALRRLGLTDATVIEVGAGSGTALATLLEAGASRAHGVDISPNYESTARGFLSGRGLEERVEWSTGDFVALAEDIPPADIVFLNRAVCCYPQMRRLLSSVASKARRYVAISYPRRRLPVRMSVGVLNLWLRINRNTFRVFVHDPAEIDSTLRDAGFESVETGTTPGWHWGVWERVGFDESGDRGGMR